MGAAVTSWPESSFWLQTSTDRFYPDFVAETLDGRMLVVEYKGMGYVTQEDFRDKKLIGKPGRATAMAEPYS